LPSSDPSMAKATLGTATSPDGVRWTPGRPSPIPDKIEMSSLYRVHGLYCVSGHLILYTHGGLNSENGHRGGRQGYVWISRDFDHWLPESGQAFLVPEPLDPNGRGTDRPYTQVHLGVGVFSYGNVFVGLYCQWQARPNPGHWFGEGTTYGDFGLLVSDDGLHFREPVKGLVFLDRRDSKVNISPDLRYEEILVQSGNGILNVGDETWIYHGRWANTERNRDYYGEVALATLPRDRWGAVGIIPSAATGSTWTAPLTLGRAATRLTLNADGLAGVRVDVADENFDPVPEFSGENAGRSASSGGLDCAVAWPRGSLDSMAGRTVRFLVHIRKGSWSEPRLYALYLR